MVHGSNYIGYYLVLKVKKNKLLKKEFKKKKASFLWHLLLTVVLILDPSAAVVYSLCSHVILKSGLVMKSAFV